MVIGIRLVLFFLLIAFTVSAQVYIPKFDLQGHRGARGIRPENTIPAFIAALDTGVTTVELDLVITKDKQIILSHEPWISQTICYPPKGLSFSKDEKKFNIYQINYDEIQKIDCGSKGNDNFPEQLKMKVSKPLLSDVITAIESHIRNHTLYEVDYNIEIKSTKQSDNKFHPSPSEFSDLVYSLLEQYLPLDRVVIQSFDVRVLKYWHEKYPTVRLAALVENSKSIDSNLSELGFKPSIYSPYFKLITKNHVQYLQQQKIRVIPWTVNEISDMKKIREMGVDGFITDYPNRAANLGLGIKRSKR
jgi:glycerophosphoryl diester phosphodiesterase